MVFFLTAVRTMDNPILLLSLDERYLAHTSSGPTETYRHCAWSQQLVWLEPTPVQRCQELVTPESESVLAEA